jgi:hypothetical protein
MTTIPIWRRICLAAALSICTITAGKALAEKKEPPKRTVQGIVTDEQENPIANAIVQLKNLKTSAVKSFYTNDKGAYRFGELDLDHDYEIKAAYNNVSSPTRKISSFESRRQLIINFKLDVKK